MNTIILLSLLTVSVGSMMIITDHHYYHVATIICLEKQIKERYEVQSETEYCSTLCSEGGPDTPSILL